MIARKQLSPVFALCALLVGIVSVTALAVAGERAESSWIDLPDDGSEDAARGELFAKYEIPAFDANAPDVKNETLAIPPQFKFPDDARDDKIEKHPRENSIFGIDISHYTDPKLNLSALKAKRVEFVYIKATQGISSKDKLFHKFWSGVAELPAAVTISRGAYHFLSSAREASGTAQADAFVDYVQLHGGFRPSDLPPVVDLEWDVSKDKPDRWVGHSADEIVQKTLDCLKQIEARTGRRPMLYTAKSWWSSRTVPLSRVNEFEGYPIWIADYNPKRKFSETPAVLPGSITAIWQFTDSAVISEQPKSYDSSIFYGSREDFVKTFGIK